MNLSELWAAVGPRVRAIVHQSEARGVRVIRTTTQSINNATLTAVSFDTAIVDTESESDAGAAWAIGAPTMLYAKRDGYYLAGGSVAFAAASVTAAARLFLAVRGTDGAGVVTYWGAAENHAISGKDAGVGVTTGMFWMSAGDYVELIVYHDIGSAKNVLAATATSQHVNNGWLMRVS